MPQIRVHGRSESGEDHRSRLERGRLSKGLLTVKHSVQVGFAREGHEPAVLDGVAEDDLIAIELRGGLRLWSSAEHLRTDYGMKNSRDASGADLLDVTTQLPLGGQSRGAGDWIIRGLKVLGVDVAGKITEFVGDKIEGQLAPGPGLYRCSASKRGDLQTPRKLDGRRPTLVFLHGTGSSKQGGSPAITERALEWMFVEPLEAPPRQADSSQGD